jgi:hypothetical protein
MPPGTTWLFLPLSLMAGPAELPVPPTAEGCTDLMNTVVQPV